MDNYPLGKDQTLALLYLASVPEGGRILDLGGRESQILVSRAGYNVQGLRRGRRGQESILECDFPEGSFDGIISQGEMYECGDMAGAFRKAAQLLKKGGKLMLSELCTEPWEKSLSEAGFKVQSCEDISAMWRAYYMDKLWAGEDVPEWMEGRFNYYTMVCEKI